MNLPSELRKYAFSPTTTYVGGPTLLTIRDGYYGVFNVRATMKEINHDSATFITTLDGAEWTLDFEDIEQIIF